jgi:hypothetical protein
VRELINEQVTLHKVNSTLRLEISAGG